MIYSCAESYEQILSILSVINEKQEMCKRSQHKKFNSDLWGDEIKGVYENTTAGFFKTSHLSVYNDGKRIYSKIIRLFVTRQVFFLNKCSIFLFLPS